MGYTVHQLCVNLMSHTFFAGDCSLYRSALTVKDFHLTADGLLYQPIRLADAVRHLTTDHFLTVKAIHGNFCVCRYDDAVRCGDFFRSQYIFRTCGTSGLDLDLAVCCFCCLLQCFRCHISVRDSGRAGSHCQELKALFLFGGNAGIT